MSGLSRNLAAAVVAHPAARLPEGADEWSGAVVLATGFAACHSSVIDGTISHCEAATCSRFADIFVLSERFF